MSPRPLTDNERAVLQHLLSVPFAGVDALRAQLAQASAADSQGANLTLVVPSSVSAADRADGPVPVTAEVRGATGEYQGDLLLWVRGGRLSLLEYAWITDSPPTVLPAPAQLRLSEG